MPDSGRSGRFIGISCAVGVLAVGSLAFLVYSQHANWFPAQDAGMQWSLVDRYCIDCHNATDNAAGIRFDQLKAGSVVRQPEIFETAVHKLRGRLMPPPGSLQPSQAQIDGLIGWLESAIDKGVGTQIAGHVPLKRMSRTEFANAVKDLLGVEIDAAEYLPSEVEVEGFSNIATALTVSPAFLEQHVRAARDAARLAVGDRVPEVALSYFPPPELGACAVRRFSFGRMIRDRGNFVLAPVLPDFGTENRRPAPQGGVNLSPTGSMAVPNRRHRTPIPVTRSPEALACA